MTVSDSILAVGAGVWYGAAGMSKPGCWPLCRGASGIPGAGCSPTLCWCSRRARRTLRPKSQTLPKYACTTFQATGCRSTKYSLLRWVLSGLPLPESQCFCHCLTSMHVWGNSDCARLIKACSQIINHIGCQYMLQAPNCWCTKQERCRRCLLPITCSN